ncbi:hypothetical protein F4680DRAFT_444779 [Xylaria scruposa]|nr:hypothetical protein F4680DRAFT_444779 [Xylaria scruposa]
MSKLLPRLSRLARLDGIESITDFKKWVTGRTDPIIYSVINFESDHGSQRSTQENQLVPHERQSHSNRVSRRDSKIAPSSRSQFPNTHNNENVNDKRSSYSSEREMITSQQRFDAIWEPQSRDLTVHLKMDVHEDLVDILEEFHCLQRLGDFSSARRYFEDNLRDHIDDPYVLVQYGEMLLEQGDYSGVLKLGSFDQYRPSVQDADLNGTQLLGDYWNLIEFFAGCHHINRRPKSFTLNRETLRLLHDCVIENERDATSTEASLHSPRIKD